MEQILSIVVRNQPGVLMRVAGMFSRRGFNIDSLAVGTTQNPEFSRMTVTMEADEPTIIQVTKQLAKLVEVERVKVLPPKSSATRSMILVKVKAGNKRPELLQLAEQLGRSREAKSVPKKDAPMETFRSLVREPATVPEQVDGLQQSDDILRLLPPELATLGITELEFEFYRKLVEKQLLTYRLHGDAWREKITERPVTRQDFDEQPRGPFIVCVDTSGSMGGFNEQCAKAFCLALMRIALADNRRCFIMLFSSEVVHYELTSESGLEQAIRFLSQRFRGGTDLASCFRAIIERLQNPQWVDADAVVISDFIAQRLPDEVIAQVGELQRKHQHRFHAVAMSVHGKPGIMRIFDHIWRFDTGMRSRLLRRWRR